MSWTHQPIFFVDFEGSLGSGILEFGVAEVHRGTVVSTRTRKCRPTGGIRAEDQAVHGLEPAALAGQAPFADEWSYFLSLRELGPLAAHYAGVENSLLPHLDSGRLEALIAALGLQARLDALALEHCPPDRRRYHAALYDALAGALLLIALAEDPQIGGLTLLQLLSLSTLDPGRRAALQQRELFSE